MALFAGTGQVEGGESIAPTKMASAPKMDLLRDPVVPRGPPAVPPN